MIIKKIKNLNISLLLALLPLLPLHSSNKEKESVLAPSQPQFAHAVSSSSAENEERLDFFLQQQDQEHKKRLKYFEQVASEQLAKKEKKAHQIQQKEWDILEKKEAQQKKFYNLNALIAKITSKGRKKNKTKKTNIKKSPVLPSQKHCWRWDKKKSTILTNVREPEKKVTFIKEEKQKEQKNDIKNSPALPSQKPCWSCDKNKKISAMLTNVHKLEKEVAFMKEEKEREQKNDMKNSPSFPSLTPLSDDNKELPVILANMDESNEENIDNTLHSSHISMTIEEASEDISPYQQDINNTFNEMEKEDFFSFDLLQREDTTPEAQKIEDMCVGKNKKHLLEQSSVQNTMVEKNMGNDPEPSDPMTLYEQNTALPVTSTQKYSTIDNILHAPHIEETTEDLNPPQEDISNTSNGMEEENKLSFDLETSPLQCFFKKEDTTPEAQKIEDMCVGKNKKHLLEQSSVQNTMVEKNMGNNPEPSDPMTLNEQNTALPVTSTQEYSTIDNILHAAHIEETTEDLNPPQEDISNTSNGMEEENKLSFDLETSPFQCFFKREDITPEAQKIEDMCVGKNKKHLLEQSSVQNTMVEKNMGNDPEPSDPMTLYEQNTALPVTSTQKYSTIDNILHAPHIEETTEDLNPPQEDISNTSNGMEEENKPSFDLETSPLQCFFKKEDTTPEAQKIEDMCAGKNTENSPETSDSMILNEQNIAFLVMLTQKYSNQENIDIDNTLHAAHSVEETTEDLNPPQQDISNTSNGMEEENELSFDLETSPLQCFFKKEDTTPEAQKIEDMCAGKNTENSPETSDSMTLNEQNTAFLVMLTQKYSNQENIDIDNTLHAAHSVEETTEDLNPPQQDISNTSNGMEEENELSFDLETSPLQCFFKKEDTTPEAQKIEDMCAGKNTENNPETSDSMTLNEQDTTFLVMLTQKYSNQENIDIDNTLHSAHSVEETTEDLNQPQQDISNTFNGMEI